MIHRLFALVLVTTLALGAAAQAPGNAGAQRAATSQTPTANGELQKVLAQMDKAAEAFKSAQADFIWDQYQLVVDETERQEGQVYFRRAGTQIHMAADITKPDRKQLVYSEGRIRFYQPRIDQMTERDVSKDRSEVESFMVLGFGGRGSDLHQQFEVTFLGWEEVDGVRTAKLNLVPKSERVRGMFDRFIMWMDPERGVSLRQQAFEPQGDYRLAHYRNIRMNQRLPDDAFRVKTTGRTKVVKQ